MQILGGLSSQVTASIDERCSGVGGDPQLPAEDFPALEIGLFYRVPLCWSVRAFLGNQQPLS
jgi:hypothetical protein